jgi:hypothetical protein
MDATERATSFNFGFLRKGYPELERIGAQSERYFSDDPIVCLITIRQFGEVLAQLAAARSGLFSDATEPEADLLRRLRIDGNYPPNVLDLFHQLRIAGNAATHRSEGDHATALGCLARCPRGHSTPLNSPPVCRRRCRPSMGTTKPHSSSGRTRAQGTALLHHRLPEHRDLEARLRLSSRPS